MSLSTCPHFVLWSLGRPKKDTWGFDLKGQDEGLLEARRGYLVVKQERHMSPSRAVVECKRNDRLRWHHDVQSKVSGLSKVQFKVRDQGRKLPYRALNEPIRIEIKIAAPAPCSN
jgi:hypothetical protein